MSICGIDLGSRNVKVAVAVSGGDPEFHKYETMSFYREYGRKQGDNLVIDFAGLGLPSVDKVVSTGYGRNTLNILGGRTIPEIRAHLVGAVWQTGLEDFTLLDLGGQDSKIIKVRKGKMVDFATNDKCAASSGRYLENMALVLGISLEELADHYQEPVDLSSTCAVFGESELIGRIVEGYPIPQLAAGINYTIFRRVYPLLRGLESEIMVFTGGVAHSKALRQIFAAELGIDVVVPRYPQFNGAIGCWREGLCK
ncbi:MAG TPA: acyl-CoA dehydratase activase [Bacillota bacterium]|nr:acyl-CoA dehydratase activase [Bacillota bacterium]